MARRRPGAALWRHMPVATADVARINALSDGVFAVAMTLLVIDLRVPEVPASRSYGDLAQAVVGVWPHLASYVLSFLVVGLYWVSHNLLFDLIRRSDRGLMWINIFFLAFVGVIPFSTALLGRYSDNHFAVVFYGANLICVGLTLQTLWSYATTGHRLVDADLAAGTIRLGTIRLLAVPLIGAFSLLVSLLSIPLGMAVYVVLLVGYSWPGWWTPYWSVAPKGREEASDAR